MERKNAVTMKGKPMTLVGSQIKAGVKAPDFIVVGTDLKETGLSAFDGKIRIIASVPSLDTPVCDMEAKRFNSEVASLSDDVVVIFISMDLPFAQSRYCAAEGIGRVKTFSDHRDASFGKAYGVLIKELRLLSRAIFVIDREGKVFYAQYVRELGEQPDYDSAFKAAKAILDK